MTRLRHPIGLALLLGSAFVLAGCPASGDGSGGPVEVCAKVGERCRLAGGQLGVCSMRPEGELFCMSQH